MNLLSDYLENVKSKNTIGNSIEFSDNMRNKLKGTKSSEKQTENTKLPYEIVQDYLREGIKKDKHIYNLVSVAWSERWSNPSRARAAFVEARRIINNRMISGESVSDGEFYFVHFFFTIEDLVAFYPTFTDEYLVPMSNHKESTKQYKSDIKDYAKGLKKHFDND